MGKLRVKLDMKPCQFMTISHTVTQMAFVGQQQFQDNSSYQVSAQIAEKL